MPSGWECLQPIIITVAYNENHWYVTDDISTVYGDGDTPESAEKDYMLSLLDYYHILHTQTDKGIPQQKEIQKWIRLTSKS